MSDEQAEGKFQGAVLARLDMLKEMVGDLRVAGQDHGKRLTVLEMEQNKWKAWAAGAGAVAALAMHYAISLFPGGKP